jgi:hypothetical protein
MKTSGCWPDLGHLLAKYRQTHITCADNGQRLQPDSGHDICTPPLQTDTALVTNR